MMMQYSELFGFADVSVAHPATATLLGAPACAAPAVASEPLFAAKKREEEKVKIYSGCRAFDGYEVAPVVLETYGGFGPKALAFLRRIAKLSDEPKEMLDRGIDMLAVALAKGNRVLEHVGIPKARLASRLHHSAPPRCHPALPVAA